MTYIGNIAIPQAAETREEFVITDPNQLTFRTAGYVPDFISVYKNGVKLAKSDFTATDGELITLTTNIAVDDILSYESRTQITDAAPHYVDSEGNTIIGVVNGNVVIERVKINYSEIALSPGDQTLKTSSGLNVLTEDTGGTVLLENAEIRLNSEGSSIVDSSGNDILSESGGVVTLSNIARSAEGYAQLGITTGKTTGNITWDLITGDQTNITKPSNDHIIRLSLKGLYLITFSLSAFLSAGDAERLVQAQLYVGGSVKSESNDSIPGVTEGTDPNYGGTTLSWVGEVNADTDIYFTATSAADNDISITLATHASIVLLHRT